MTTIGGDTTKGTGEKSRFVPSDMGAVLGLILLAIVGFSVIRPGGDFPLNDDWAFILPVKWFVEQGRLQFTDWQFMTLIGQVFVGVALMEVTGFSITALRWLAIGLAVMSVLLVYGTARATRSTMSASLLAALLLLCNPIFVVTATSFMTDIPFVTACLAAVFLRVASSRRRSTALLVLAWLFVVLACSIRQSGIAVAVGFIAFDYVQRGSALRAFRDSLLPALFITALLASYPSVLEHTIGVPSMFNQPNQEVKSFLTGLMHLRLGYLLMALKTFFVAVGYLGFCMAPLAPLIVEGKSSRGRIAVITGMAALIAIAMIAVGRAIPVHGNTFFDFGLGVRTLPSIEPTPTAPAGFWWTMAFLVGLGVVASAVAAASLRWRRSVQRPSQDADRNACVAMLVTTLCIYNVPFLMRGGIWFDRYAILNVALFGILVAPCLELSRWKKVSLAATTAMLTAFFAFGVAGTHDYIEWNRQRWLAADAVARQQGVDAAQIDGGFEYNNYQARLGGDRHRPPDAVVVDNPAAPFRIAFSPLPRHTVISVRPCDTWLYGSPRAIYVLRADATSGS